LFCFYLKVRDDFTEGAAHEPSLSDVPQDGRRQAEEYDEKIGDGQIDDEHVGDGSHRVIAVNSQTDQEVADQADDKYHAVEANQNPFVDGWKHVRLDSVNVVIVRLAIIIRARFIANEFNHVSSQVGAVQLVGAIHWPVAVVVESFHFRFRFGGRQDDLNV
jgi:hypothetical protein